jgi:hypothetical protein
MNGLNGVDDSSETAPGRGKDWGAWIGGSVAFLVALYFLLAPRWMDALDRLVSSGVIPIPYGGQIRAPIERLFRLSHLYYRMYDAERRLAMRAGLIPQHPSYMEY